MTFPVKKWSLFRVLLTPVEIIIWPFSALVIMLAMEVAVLMARYRDIPHATEGDVPK